MAQSTETLRLPCGPAVAPRRSFASLRCIIALMLREMATTYGRSVGGYFWVLLEPIAGIALLTFAFSFVFHKPPLGPSFELFYATGMLPFLMFTSICNKVSGAITFSRPLLLYPAVTHVDALLARFLVSLITSLVVFIFVISGILALYDTRAILDLQSIALSLLMAAGFGLCLGSMNAYLFLQIPVWQVFWSIISRPLFLVSGVMFTYDHLPHDLKSYLWWNPLTHVVGMMRKGFYPSYIGDYISPAFVFGLSLALLAAGLMMLRWRIKPLLHDV